MSSVKEYWKRDSATARSHSETSSSDDLYSSTSKEYRNACCNVDFDDETNELIDDENISNVKLTENFDELTTVTRSKNNVLKLSRYVRWNVLMSLGIGLWAVLCIVDLLHSEKSVTRDLLYESMWGKKIVPKIALEKKLETPILWYANVWPYLWKIVTVTTSGGAYVLLFLLMIVFCADPRLKNNGRQSFVKNNVVQKISVSKKTVKNSIVEKRSLGVRKKLPNARFDEPTMPKIVSVRLELAPSTDLQRKFLFTIEKCVQADFMKFDNSPKCNPLCTSERRVVKFVDNVNNRRNESVGCFSINRQLVELLDARDCVTLKFSNVNKIDGKSMKKVESNVKDSASLCLMDTRSKRYLNFNASTFDLEIGEYLRRTRKSSGDRFNEDSLGHNVNTRDVTNFRPLISNYGRETTRTRIITSSPAFKKFFSNYQHNSGVS